MLSQLTDLAAIIADTTRCGAYGGAPSHFLWEPTQVGNAKEQDHNEK